MLLTRRAARREGGFSIIEFMIALTLSLIVLAALTGAFVANSRSRTEIERANEQVENGRFALQLLTDDLELAGFYSHLNLTNIADSPLPDGLPPPGSTGNPITGKPDPCVTAISGYSTSSVGIDWAIKMHIQGVDNLPDANSDGVAELPSGFGTCLAGQQLMPGSDIVVIRRAATCVAGATNCAVVDGAPYIQASLCADELNQLDPRNYLRIAYFAGGTTVSPNRKTRLCGASIAQARQFMTNIYFVAKNDRASDGIPTLKRAELGASGGSVGWTIVPLAHGIQMLQIEYGVDTANNDGVPDVFTANPDRYNRSTPSSPYASCAAAVTNCVSNWRDTMAARLYVLARNTTESRDFTDSKVYQLGNQFGGAAQYANNGSAFNDKYKRHVFQTSVRLNNPAGRREQ